MTEGSAEQVLSGERNWVVLTGDCRTRLAEIPDNSIDSVVVDVPYGLGTREPTIDEIIAYLTGASELNTGGDFMGKKWQVPSVAVWREVFRVMRPGAHLLCFGGTRTWDLISMGIRASGFELRDSIAMHSAALMWCYGQGFPKSLSVSKAIDKRAGAKREVVGTRLLTGNAAQSTEEKGGTYASNTDSRGVAPKQVDVTAPATDDAKKWDGWGTALRPSWEPILAFRKPLSGTVVETVLDHGTGAINVDACRIGTDWSDRSESWKRSGHSAKPDAEKIAAPPGTGINCHELGRWPGNMLLVHSEGCRHVGTKQAKARVINRWTDGAKPFGGGAGHDYEQQSCGESEDVAVWDCIDGCPVKALAEQSGYSSTPTSVPNPQLGVNDCGVTNFGCGTGRNGERSVLPGDSGSADRFFTQFPPDAPFLYHAKASKRDRNLGLADNDTNNHSTVKPEAVIRWLQRLVTPPGGVTLDFTCGSGTGGVSAISEGFRFIGIELDQHSADIARKRIAGAFPLLARAKALPKVDSEIATEPPQTELFA